MSAPEQFEEISVASRNFAGIQLYEQSIKHQSIKCSTGPETTLPDGSRVVLNDKGDVVFMNYSGGATVIRHAEFVMCTNVFDEHWFRTKGDNWCRVD
jgi:hypothetical protein